MNRAALKKDDNAVEPVLYMAMELSGRRWKLVFGDGEKRRQVRIEAGHRIEEAIGKAKERFHLPADALSCYEAGRNGFWLHRYLWSLGIENRVMVLVIETNRRGNKRKPTALTGIRLGGESRAGNRRYAPRLIEFAYVSRRYQPHSKLSRWFRESTAFGGSRTRLVGIVALARRLLMTLWRYLEKGLVAGGADLRSGRQTLRRRYLLSNYTN